MNDIYTTQISESIESVFANMEQRISAEDMQRMKARGMRCIGFRIY